MTALRCQSLLHHIPGRCVGAAGAPWAQQALANLCELLWYRKGPKVCPKGLPQGALSPHCEHTVMETRNGSDIPSQEYCHHQRQVPSPVASWSQAGSSPSPLPQHRLCCPSRDAPSIPTKRTRQGPSLSCTALESVSSSTGLGCQGNSRHSMSFSTSTRPCRVITSPLESRTIRVGMPAVEKNSERDQPKHELARDRVWGERPFPMASGSGRSPASLLPLCSSQSGDQAPWILFPSQQSTAIQEAFSSGTACLSLAAVWCPRVQISQYHPWILPLAPPSQC